VDLEVAARALGIAKLERADANRAKAVTGFSIGATPPVGHSSPLPVLMDEDLLQHDVVWAAAGRPDSVFAADPRELARASEATVCRLTT
jgi:prolyl-tRNA editing enzyme YbaK/EbsC (Cys-tRNA(Pro) deacylase)